MGNIWNKSNKAREEVLDDIKIINAITLQKIFMDKTSYSLLFSLDDNGFFKKINSKNLIKVKIKRNKNTKEKTIKLSLDEFYVFHNSLLDSINIFYDDKIKERMTKIKNKDESDNGLCPICNENTINTMLKCYHCFCEHCIKTWLLEKNNSCPFCRLTINVDKKDEKIEILQWDIINKVNKDELDTEIKNRFFQSLNNIVNK